VSGTRKAQTMEHLYGEGTHPRVLFDRAGLARLKRMTARGTGRKILLTIRDRVRPSIEAMLADEDVAGEPADRRRERGVRSRAVVRQASEIALVGLLLDDADAIEAVVRALTALANAETRQRRPGQERSRASRVPRMLPVAFDLVYDHMDPAERRRLVEWLTENVVRRSVRQMRVNFLKGAGANMAASQLYMCILTALAIWNEPGAGDLAAERENLVRFFEANCYAQLGIDGYPAEDSGYGTLMTGRLYVVAEALRRAGWYDAFASCPRVLKFPDAMLHLVQPWGGHISNTGDHTDQFGRRELSLLLPARRLGNPAYRWLATTLSYGRPEREVPLDDGGQIPASALTLLALEELTGVKPVHPKDVRPAIPTAYRDRDRGIVSFRSSWDEDATLLIFDGSQRTPAAAGHAHASSGHFTITALGEYFAIDTGRYNIDQDQHNLLLIDGKSGRSTKGEWTETRYSGRLVQYVPGRLCDYASVDSSHQYGGAYWAWRAVGLVRGGHAEDQGYVWTVDDVNKWDAWAEYWWTLNTSDENKIKTGETSAEIVGCRRGNVMDIAWAIPAKGDYRRPHEIVEVTQDIQTTSSYKYVGDPFKSSAHHCVMDRPADSVHGSALHRPRLIARLQGLNGKIMSVMIPRKKDQPAPTIRQIPSVMNSVAMQIDFAEVTDTIIWAFEHHLLEAGEVKARGKWCVVRRSRRTGEVIGYQIHEGDRLEVAGAPLPVGSSR